MIERKEVEAMLAEAERGERHITGSHTMAALCRAWLAVQDAPEVCVSKSALMGEGWKIYGTDGDNIESLPFEDGQRVRIVKEARET